MYKLISHNIDLLLADPKLRDGVRDYASLLARLHAVDVSSDEGYQQLYRRFWALNAARVSSNWCAVYFTILQREKASAARDLRAIVLDLRGATGTGPLQVSFASKLVHMVDPQRPIYDSLIAAFYFFKAPTSGSPESRLEALLAFYRFLEAEYARVLAGGLLSPATARFRSVFPEAERFSAVKIVDFLLWTCVRLLHGGAQRRGDLLYPILPCSS